MSDIISDFIKKAQARPVEDAVRVLDLKLPRQDNHGGPCPICKDGKDRFSVSIRKNAWNCRHCCVGGHGGLGLVGAVLKFDLKSRSGLLEACSVLLCEQIPDQCHGETEEERQERKRRIQEDLERAEKDAADREKKNNSFRQREITRARGIYQNALTVPHSEDGLLHDYIRFRTGHALPAPAFESIRFTPRCTYWHGQDERGNPVSRYVGFAMILPFIDLSGHVTGCHQTWIDIGNAPKFRPDLGPDEKGEPLPTKKMRGTKKGSIIPLCGELSAVRWVGGEGIETTLAVAGYERFRDDTFYFATGDLGNMAGPDDKSSSIKHPTLTKTDKAGRVRAVKIPGPKPRADQSASDAFQIPDHVTALVLLADGDSEFIFTAAAMARAKARLSREGRSIGVWWPARGMDFASLLSDGKNRG